MAGDDASALAPTSAGKRARRLKKEVLIEKAISARQAVEKATARMKKAEQALGRCRPGTVDKHQLDLAEAKKALEQKEKAAADAVDARDSYLQQLHVGDPDDDDDKENEPASGKEQRAPNMSAQGIEKLVELRLKYDDKFNDSTNGNEAVWQVIQEEMAELERGGKLAAGDGSARTWKALNVKYTKEEKRFSELVNLINLRATSGTSRDEATRAAPDKLKKCAR